MIVVVVPAFNEEKKIGRVVRGLFEQGMEHIVVVDDGSRDATGETAQAAGAHVLRHAVNRGQGAALQTGHAYARRVGADVVVHFDGDDQLSPNDIAGAVEALHTKQVDIVLGSRYLDTRSNVPWLKRYIISKIARIINFLFTGIWLSDAHNGFRVFNNRSLQVMQLRQDGMAHASEILKLVAKNKLRYAEYPVAVTYHEFGQSFGGGFKIIWDLIFS